MVDEALLSATGMASLAAYAVRGRSSQLIAPSVWHGNRTRPAIALTFDDGPSESTPQLLELLAMHQVKATFFMCGQNVRRCPEIAREVTSAGHEIGNHTESHPYFSFKSPEFIYREMACAQESIEEVTSIRPALFRAPYGIRWPGLREAQERLQLTGAMWTTIGRDWKWPAPRIANLLLKEAKNGAIFCLHDGRAVQPDPDIHATMEAVRTILPKLKERGFSFETVTQVCAK